MKTVITVILIIWGVAAGATISLFVIPLLLYLFGTDRYKDGTLRECTACPGKECKACRFRKEAKKNAEQEAEDREQERYLQEYTRRKQEKKKRKGQSH